MDLRPHPGVYAELEPDSHQGILPTQGLACRNNEMPVKLWHKIKAYKIPEHWSHPDSLPHNIAQLFFWAVVTGVLLFLLTKCD